MFAVLVCVDPEEHKDRWYMVTIQPTLFEPVAVVCAWGNRQNSWQQLRILPADSTITALEEAQNIIAQKLQRGYTIVVQTAIPNTIS